MPHMWCYPEIQACGPVLISRISYVTFITICTGFGLLINSEHPLSFWTSKINLRIIETASYDIWCRDLDTDQTSTEQTCGRTDQNGKKYAQHHIQR